MKFIIGNKTKYIVTYPLDGKQYCLDFRDGEDRTIGVCFQLLSDFKDVIELANNVNFGEIRQVRITSNFYWTQYFYTRNFDDEWIFSDNLNPLASNVLIKQDEHGCWRKKKQDGVWL